MVKALAFLDLWATFILLILMVGCIFHLQVPKAMLIVTALCLLPKLFLGICFASVIDIFASLILISGVFVSLPFWLPLIAAVGLGQKGIISFFAYNE